MRLIWAGEVQERLRELITDTPVTYRKYIIKDARACAELHAQRMGKSEIDEEAMVRGYITCIPRHLRDGVREVLSQHNIDISYYRSFFDEPNPLQHLPPAKPHLPL